MEIYSIENKDGGAEKYGLKNTYTHTEPIILHGNGLSKQTLNYLSNYLPNNWNSVDGCRNCKSNLIDLSNLKETELPTVFLAVFIEFNTPFLEEQLEKIADLHYPKEKLHLFIHNNVSGYFRSVKADLPDRETILFSKYDEEFFRVPSFVLTMLLFF